MGGLNVLGLLIDLLMIYVLIQYVANPIALENTAIASDYNLMQLLQIIISRNFYKIIILVNN